MSALTARDKAANSVTPLLYLADPRADVPLTLPMPAASAAPAIAQNVPAPESTVDSGTLPGFVHIALRQDLALAPPAQQHAILARVQTIQTRAQAAQYIAEVKAKLQAAKAGG